VLFVSGDLDEVMELSDRIAIMYDGQIMAVLPRHEASIEKLGLLMTGIGVEDTERPEVETGELQDG